MLEIWVCNVEGHYNPGVYIFELSARTKTEEKYISERLHKALEKRVNKITRG